MACCADILRLAFVLVVALVHATDAQCLLNEFTIDEESPNGTIVGNLFERNASRALQCLTALLPPNETAIDVRGSVSEMILTVIAIIGPPVLRDDSFAFRDGNLIVKRRLNRETLCPTRPRCTIDAQLSFVSSAGNRAVFPFRVYVRDKDDNEAFWQSSQPVVRFYEQLDSKRKEFLGSVVDLDAVRDNFTTLRFVLLDPTSVFELSVAQADSLEEDKTSYDVFLGVRPTARLDRETRSAYLVHVCIRNHRSPAPTAQSFAVDSQANVLRTPTNSCVPVNVTVLDDNDNPPIISPNDTVHLNVSERTPVDQVIFRFNATDLDEGINALLRFRFAASQSDRDTFAINDQGELSVRRRLDFETTKHYVLKIDVSDSSSKPQTSTVEVFVTVLDENDEHPTIRIDPSTSNPSVTLIETSTIGSESDDQGQGNTLNDQLVTRNVTVYVNENTIGELVELTVTDRDSGNSGRVVCTLLDRSARVFALRPITSGLNFAIDSTVKLDSENDSHSALAFAIECTDSGRPPLRTVLNARVLLLDMNDNAPRFSSTQLNASVDENLEPGAYVAQVHANDPDSSESGSVRYHLQNADSVPFRIDERNGEITSRVRLDRETVDSYTLLVVAADNGNQSLSATATVTVRVIDQNDQAPRFQRNVYLFYVAEEIPIDSIVGQVSASDADAGENAQLTYSLNCDDIFNVNSNANANANSYVQNELVPSAASTQRGLPSAKVTDAPVPFAVHRNTGQLVTVGRLDREACSTYTFRVCAIDGGFPVKATYTHVTVNVLDVNDNSPTWVFPNATHFVVNVTRALPIGGTITYVRAQDPDLFENGSVIYSILSGNQHKLFQLDPLDGALLIGRQLQVSDLHQVHRLHLEAADRPLIGDARASTHHLVIVMLIDHSQLEVARREEQPFSDLSFVIVLAIGTVTMLITLFLIVVCICMIQKKRSRENRRDRRRANDRSRSVSRASSKHNVSHTSVKTQAQTLSQSRHNRPNSFHTSFSDQCLSKFGSPPLFKDGADCFSDVTSDAGTRIIDEIDGRSRNMTVSKYYDEGEVDGDGDNDGDGDGKGSHYEDENRNGVANGGVASDVYDDYLKRWIIAFPNNTSAAREREHPSSVIDKRGLQTQALAESMDCNVPSISTMLGVQQQPQQHHVLSGTKLNRLATFTGSNVHRDHHSANSEDLMTRSGNANLETMTPLSDQEPTLDSIHNQFQLVQNGRAGGSYLSTDASDTVSSGLSRSLHTTPARQTGSANGSGSGSGTGTGNGHGYGHGHGHGTSAGHSKSKNRRRNSKPNIYTCVSHTTAAAPFQFTSRVEHSVAAAQKHDGKVVNFPLNEFCRPPLIDIAAYSYNYAPRQVDIVSLPPSAQDVDKSNSNTPPKHPVSPITTYMTRSPTTPCIDEYRPAQSQNVPTSCSSRRNTETAAEQGLADSINNSNENRSAAASASASASATALAVRCTSALSHTQTTFV